jgi:hypothetical protein
MGNYAECWLGSLYVGATKNDIDPDLMLLFRAEDKVTVQGTAGRLPFQVRRWMHGVERGEEVVATFYRAPLPAVRDRLELRGYTLAVARAACARSFAGEAALYKKWAEGSQGKLFEPIARVLGDADVDAWLAALREIRRKRLKQRSVGGSTEAYAETLLGYMLEHDWYGYSGPDLSVGLRLALEVCPDSEKLIYDVTDLILSGYFAPEDDLVEYALALTSSEYSTHGKIIVLTEGRSDSRILIDSLKLLHPHLADYFTFMDFDGVRLGGGAGNLANIVKAFAGAGIANRVVALFDNDTAAEASLQTLRSVRLPSNIKVLKLPELADLCNYPTIGPSGTVAMNVNGIAASIELYLGADVLMDEEGNLTPVQWTGYEPSLSKYQGEVMLKDRIQERFARRLDACRQNPELLAATDWVGVQAILSILFLAFRDVDGEEICSAIESYYIQMLKG